MLIAWICSQELGFVLKSEQREALELLLSPLSLASHALRACKARALRARKTLTPRFTDFFTDSEKKTDCFAVYVLFVLFIDNLLRVHVEKVLGVVISDKLT